MRHLFQNRYKSILCQEETYLTELVRYIHLNPLRAKIVKDLSSLDRYAFFGHSTLMGNRDYPCQDTATVFQRFDSAVRKARRRYREFVKKRGIARPQTRACRRVAGRP